MKPTMLISAGDTALGNHLVEKALADGFNVVATTTPLPRRKPNQRTKDAEKRAENERLLLVPWTRQSPVSARNLILCGLNSFDTIDDAIIVHNLTKEMRTLHELPSAFIQEAIDAQLKSHVFLIKELISHFLKRKEGSLSLVVNREGAGVLSAIDSLLTSGFTALAASLFSVYQNEHLVINGFDSISTDAEDYASFILSATSEKGRRNTGKWHTHAAKGGFLRAGLLAKNR